MQPSVSARKMVMANILTGLVSYWFLCLENNYNGNRCSVKEQITLNYKGLLLLWEKEVGDNDFLLGGTGLASPFFKGMRDNLTSILDEDLSSHCLCALHCEMRNTEQLLKSVGLLAYEIGSLPECNAALSNYGPENFTGDRIKVKLKHGQKTAAGRNNIKCASCSERTERQILNDIEGIVDKSLPRSKL
ncbi:uncharacterized protein LOC144648374 [Oculina patagonica]